MTARPRAEDDRRIDDVGGSSETAELPGFSRTLVVERFDLDFLGAEQASEPRLTTTTVAPYLTDDAGRYGQGVPMVEASRDQRHDATIAALEGNQRPRIQRQPRPVYRRGRRLRVTPSARSASRRSAGVRGPPDSASISSSRVASSSSLTFSSSADATYALTLGARPWRTARRLDGLPRVISPVSRALAGHGGIYSDVGCGQTVPWCIVVTGWSPRFTKRWTRFPSHVSVV